MTGGDRFFRAALAEQAGPDVAPVLLLRARSRVRMGSARVNQAQLLGVDDALLEPCAGPVPSTLCRRSAWR